MRPPTDSLVGTSTFTYRCTNGHVVGAQKALSACPAYRKGKPCDGTLERTGKGSRRPRGKQ